MSEIKTKMRLRGYLTLTLRDRHGKVKDVRHLSNLIVTAGKNALATWLAAATQSAKFMSFLAVGTGTNAAAVTDTALQTEIGTRVDGTLSASANARTNTGTFAAGNGTGAITEAGMLSASSGGTLLARVVFSAINKAAGDSLTLTWTTTFS